MAREGASPSADDGSGIDAVLDELRGWSRHWAAVGALQRQLPAVVRRRLQSLTPDPDGALEQTRHLFAHEFPPDAVAALQARVDAALAAVERLLPTPTSSTTVVGRSIEATQFAVTVRDVV